MRTEPIRSRSNPLVRRLRELARRGSDDDVALAEGVRLIEEALVTNLRIEEVALSPRIERVPHGPELVAAIERAGASARWVEDGVLASVSSLDASPGAIAIVRRPAFAASDLLQGTPLVLVLDGVQNPGNVGAVLRAAEAAGASGALLTTHSADPLSWKALRGSMGSAFRLPHLRRARPEVRAFLRDAGLAQVGTSPSGGRPPESVDLRRPIALVLGGEAGGISAELQHECHEHISIPLRPPVESLNVAVAAGILLFEAARQRRT